MRDLQHGVSGIWHDFRAVRGECGKKIVQNFLGEVRDGEDCEMSLAEPEKNMIVCSDGGAAVDGGAIFGTVFETA